ncbi:hypothetical protein KC19_2G085900 [Ceratodon purpureus]|uniref:Uncharacterized protein n=1 Tax=Ceratodon purpureus TaxID=3225 RepID=A0A8T0ITC0_CERPU|nr:hypothetical protein KC19_2G085900 [Ceratodon purpureus]
MIGMLLPRAHSLRNFDSEFGGGIEALTARFGAQAVLIPGATQRSNVVR